MRDRHDHARQTDPLLLQFAGMVRRMAITLTAKALWQLAGFRQADGTTETRTVEPFAGIGFFSRPPSSGAPEAIVLMVSDARNPVVVATRDEKTRAAIAGALAEDETATYNSQSIFVHRADGSMEARSASGIALPLAILDDMNRLYTAIHNWVPIANDGGAALKAAIEALHTAGWPVGTQKLKGE